MVYLNEWLPNPAGKDDPAEFIELFNRSSSTISLDGWALWTGKGKVFSLSGYVMRPDGYVALKKADTKISLKNADGALFLYGPGGMLVDHAAFAGAAPDGKSFSRIDYGTADTEHFAFVDPTPGTANKTINDQIAFQQYPVNVPLNAPLGTIQFLCLMIAAALVITVALAYIFYRNENSTQLIFESDPKIW